MGSIFQEMIDKWPSPIVARTETAAFTGGLLNERTLANYDSLGTGPAGRFRLGRKVVYPVAELVAWLEARSSAITGRHPNPEGGE